MPNTRSEASRENGAKSKGPVTPEGKARSSRNAIKHGLSSEHAILNHEDRPAFEAMRQSYLERHQPADQHEADLIETMVAARWRLNRMVMVEGQLFEKELAVRAPEINKQFREIDPEGKLAICFEHLAEGRALSLLLRYESQINRTYERAFKQLQALQAGRTDSRPCPPEPVPNEPKLLEFPPPNEPEMPVTPPPEPSQTPDPPPATPDFEEETPIPTV